MATAFRDRTAEFRSVTQTLKRIGGISTVVQNESQSPPSNSLTSSRRSEFNKKASLIGIGVHDTSEKIARLEKLAKRSSMFDDPVVEIQELTVLIKNDITALNGALTDLQAIQNLEIAEMKYSEDRVVHLTAVSDDLKSKLMDVTKQLQGVLTSRTQNIKAHENRKQIFSSKENPFLRQAKPVSVPPPPPWSSSANALHNESSASELPPNGVQAGNQLRRRAAVDSAPSNHMEMSMLQQVVPRQENYAQSRNVALHSVESTIAELGNIFTNLATMVAHQGELAIRIDDNMDESLANVENARSALLRHLNQISSNRWLLIKMFAILIFFLMVFIFFVA